MIVNIVTFISSFAPSNSPVSDESGIINALKDVIHHLNLNTI